VPVIDRQDTLPPAVIEAFAAAVAFSLQCAGTVLELNVSIPRISESLVHRGYEVSRLYIAAKKSKPAARLDPGQQLHTDMHLPFADQAFCGVYALEASTTLPDLSAAPVEIKRLIAPQGLFINVTTNTVRTDISNNMDVGWDVILKRNNLQRPETPIAAARREFEDILRASGATCEPLALSRWKMDYSPRRRLVAAAGQVKHFKLSEDTVDRFMRDYERWLKAQYGTIDAPLQLVRETTLHIWRWK
jgi:hypothetical protein